MKHYVQYRREVIEVYEVETDDISGRTAKELVKKNHNVNAPNIVDRKENESFLIVNGAYRYMSN